MRTAKMLNPNSKRFSQAWRLYTSVFPSNERRPRHQLVGLLKNPQYYFAQVTEGNRLVGLLGLWKLPGFVFIEHMAIQKSRRDRGIGSSLLQKILQENPRVVLEVEPPQTEEQKRRIRFYERLGFQLNSYAYIQPTYSPQKKPVRLRLMTFPKGVSETEFFRIRRTLHTIVYGQKKPVVKV